MSAIDWASQLESFFICLFLITRDFAQKCASVYGFLCQSEILVHFIIAKVTPAMMRSYWALNSRHVLNSCCSGCYRTIFFLFQVHIACISQRLANEYYGYLWLNTRMLSFDNMHMNRAHTCSNFCCHTFCFFSFLFFTRTRDTHMHSIFLLFIFFSNQKISCLEIGTDWTIWLNMRKKNSSVWQDIQ